MDDSRLGDAGKRNIQTYKDGAQRGLQRLTQTT